MKQYGKRKSHISSKFNLISIYSNTVRHPIVETFTTLQYTSPNYTSFHFTTLVDISLPPI